MDRKILDIGAGPWKYPGSLTIDINKKFQPDILHDLNVHPWPVNDSEFDVVHSSHCIEHLDDPEKAISEMYRVAKPGGLLILTVPHFSSRLAWTDIEHKRAFSINVLRNYTGKFAERGNSNMRFEIRKIMFRWQPKINVSTAPSWLLRTLPIFNLLNDIISGLANTNVEFCERIWCYLAGGMGEVKFYARVLK